MNQKDTIYIENKSLDSLSKNLNYLHVDIHKNLNRSDERFLGASYDTAFTVFITLFVFIAGILIDRGLKFRQEKNEQKDLRKYFSNQIKEIIFSIGPNLSKGYKQFYQKEIGIDQGIPATAPKVLTNNFERLLKMESVKLYGSFPEKEKEKFNEYFSHIDFLANLLREIDSFHTLILIRSENIRREIGPLHLDFYNSLVEFVEFEKANNPNYGDDENYRYVFDMLMLFKNEVAGKRALKFFHDKILKSTTEYFKNKNLHVEHPMGIEIYNTGKLTMTKYHDLKFLIVEVKLQYRVFYNKINESIFELKTLYNS